MISLENRCVTLWDIRQFLKCRQAFYLTASGQFRYPTRAEERQAGGNTSHEDSPPPADSPLPLPPTREEAAMRFLRAALLFRARRFGDVSAELGLHSWFRWDWQYLAHADAHDPLSFRFNLEGFQVEIKHPNVIAPAAHRPVFDVAPFEIFDRKLNNTQLGIRGTPDLVHPAGGAMIPAAIYWPHEWGPKKPNKPLELAFYWLLMEPHRTKATPPKGVLFSPCTGKAPEELEISGDVEELKETLAKIRIVLRDGVRPRLCSCSICDYQGELRPPLLDEIREQAHKNKHVSILRNIRKARIDKLEDMGIFTIDELEQSEKSKNPAKKSGTRAHIESYQKNTPVVFGKITAMPESFIVLDLEYERELIWIVGFCVVRLGHQPEYHVLWADSEVEEKANLKKFAEVAKAQRKLPVITWSGNIADIPALKKAAARHKLVTLLSGVYRRHRDLYRELNGAVRFPRKKMGVDDVASWFGFQRRGDIPKGISWLQEAYFEYHHAKDTRQAEALKAKLLQYNRDDLDALAFIVGKIPELQAQEGAKAI